MWRKLITLKDKPDTFRTMRELLLIKKNNNNKKVKLLLPFSLEIFFLSQLKGVQPVSLS